MCWPASANQSWPLNDPTSQRHTLRVLHFYITGDPLRLLVVTHVVNGSQLFSSDVMQLLCVAQTGIDLYQQEVVDFTCPLFSFKWDNHDVNTPVWYNETFTIRLNMIYSCITTGGILPDC